MAKAIVKGVRDGKEVQIPSDLDAIYISTSIGDIYIDLAGPVPDMVLMRAKALPADVDPIGSDEQRCTTDEKLEERHTSILSTGKLTGHAQFVS